MKPNILRNALIALLVGPMGLTWAQEITESGRAAETRAQEIVEEYLGQTKPPKARVLLLGTFHFKDAGLDGFKPQHEVNISSAKRQTEIAGMVEALSRFKPTHVAVERKQSQGDALNDRYRKYLAGDWKLEANEIYQLGFRIAKEAGHTELHPIDAPGRWLEPRIDTRIYVREKGLSKMLRNPYTLAFDRLARYMDESKMERSLSEHLLLMNSKTMLTAQHGVYFQQSMALGIDEEYANADGFVSQWYNRNLRIFANIQRLKQGNEERILVIMGAGHVPLLRHFIKSAPGYELVEVNEYL